MVLVRSFTEQGMKSFEAFLASYQEGKSSPDDARELAASTSLSVLVSNRVQIDIPATANKRLFAMAVCDAFEDAGVRELPFNSTQHDRGMWTWLAAISFNLIRPRTIRASTGTPQLRDSSYYILSENNLRVYRHRVARPTRIYWMYRNDSQNTRLFLRGNLWEVSEFEERLAVNLRYLSNAALIEAAHVLYYDSKNARQKPRAVSEATNPGVLRRFMTVIDQLDQTYDLRSMSSEQIVDLLPREFDRWKGRAARV